MKGANQERQGAVGSCSRRSGVSRGSACSSGDESPAWRGQRRLRVTPAPRTRNRSRLSPGVCGTGAPRKASEGKCCCKREASAPAFGGDLLGLRGARLPRCDTTPLGFVTRAWSVDARRRPSHSCRAAGPPTAAAGTGLSPGPAHRHPAPLVLAVTAGQGGGTGRGAPATFP